MKPHILLYGNGFDIWYVLPDITHNKVNQFGWRLIGLGGSSSSKSLLHVTFWHKRSFK